MLVDGSVLRPCSDLKTFRSVFQHTTTTNGCAVLEDISWILHECPARNTPQCCKGSLFKPVKFCLLHYSSCSCAHREYPSLSMALAWIGQEGPVVDRRDQLAGPNPSQAMNVAVLKGTIIATRFSVLLSRLLPFKSGSPQNTSRFCYSAVSFSAHLSPFSQSRCSPMLSTLVHQTIAHSLPFKGVLSHAKQQQYYIIYI